MVNSNFDIRSLGRFLGSKVFFKHLLFIIGFFLIVVISLLLWLRVYTNHGQELVLPDFRNRPIEEVVREARKKKFMIVVDDSTHIVGKKGGLVIDQNPKPTSRVKENRKVYLTITKFAPDKIRLKDLPSLYGRNYDAKKKELNILQIKTRIRDYKYDLGEPNYILEAYYNGTQIVSRDGNNPDVEIEKGGTIEFVLSKKSGGSINLPNLKCMTLEQAIFILESTHLQLGAVRKNGVITSETEGYVIDQIPSYSPDATITIGSSVELTISHEKPTDCD